MRRVRSGATGRKTVSCNPQLADLPDGSSRKETDSYTLGTNYGGKHKGQYQIKILCCLLVLF